ncbi:MAG TPA: NAD(P)H-hydrate dehydratase [Aggregatilineales bacterium]|nr:NAD(P)H-hydrate dehydratase [Aggregatilineales bacterium]
MVAGRLLAERLKAAEREGQIVLAFLRMAETERGDLALRAKAAGCSSLDGTNGEALRAAVAGADVIVDALLGTGTRLPLRGEIVPMLQNVRHTVDALRAGKASALHDVILPLEGDDLLSTHPYIIAVDVPSGMDADTGVLAETPLAADETITFEAAKPGHFLFPAAEVVGHLAIASLNLPPNLPEGSVQRTFVANAAAMGEKLPKRPRSAHKGTFGKVLIIGGSENYIGAPGLAALGAYKVGAGLVTIAAPPAVVNALAAQMLEVTWLPLPNAKEEGRTISDAGASIAYTNLPDYTAALIGPGMGRSFNAYGLFETIFQHAGTNIPPLVIDADGLNILATRDEWWSLLPRRTILTPHPGEMARLAGLDTEQHSGVALVQGRRLALAREKAAQWGCVVALKGAFTVVADPDGEAVIIPFADATLARAGTGDVLAGAIVGLLAQGLSPFEAAYVGAYVHGYAGSLAAEITPSVGVMARDVAERLSTAIERLMSL